MVTMHALQPEITLRGFTLVEMSIVLVIIGLLVGGVIIGRDMVENADRREFITNIDKYKVAMNTFQLKYDYLPGDYPKAYALWGANCVPGALPAAADLCNGDGNGMIEFGMSTAKEYLYPNKHLFLAGMIPSEEFGFYSHKYNELCVSWVEYDNNWTSPKGHYLMTVNRASVAGNNGCVSIGDGRWLDDKLDDGNAYRGVIQARSASGQCLPNQFDNYPSIGYLTTASMQGNYGCRMYILYK